MKSLLKNLVIFLVLAGMLYVGYNFFFAGNSLELNTGAVSGQGTVLTQEFLIRLNELEKINISREIFDDARFRSLTYFGAEPDVVSSGRSNPFTP